MKNSLYIPYLSKLTNWLYKTALKGGCLKPGGTLHEMAGISRILVSLRVLMTIRITNFRCQIILQGALEEMIMKETLSLNLCFLGLITTDLSPSTRARSTIARGIDRFLNSG